MVETQVQRNLHIVFTMNPKNPGFHNRSSSSPALFNRCVVDWFGDWSRDSLLQVGLSLTETCFVRAQRRFAPMLKATPFRSIASTMASACSRDAASAFSA